MQRRHHRFTLRCRRRPLTTAAAALPKALRGRRPVLARPAAVADRPEGEAHLTAVRVGADPIVGPPAAAAAAALASLFGLLRDCGGGGRDRGGGGGGGDDDRRMAGASDACGSAALLSSVATKAGGSS